MAHRTIRVMLERTVVYSREVIVQVEETDERLKDAKRWPALFRAEAEDAAKARAGALTGWEQTDLQYHAKAEGDAQPGGMVDVRV